MAAFHQQNLRSSSASGSAASSSSSSFHFLNSPFGDTTYTKVFVGGLAWETKDETLRRHFEQFGDILEAVVITDKNSGRSKGYGFVTFRDAEAARRACENPSPVIDGRRANCNLASLGRPPPPVVYAQPRLAGPYFGGVPVQLGAYIGSNMHPNSVPYNYQQGYPFPSYSYSTYGPDYLFPQNMHNPYTVPQHMQMYGIPGSVNTPVYPHGQFGQPIPGGRGFATVPGYVTGHRVVPIIGTNVNGASSAPRTAMRVPYPAGLATMVPSQPRFVVPSHSTSFTQGSGSEQATG